MSSGIIGEQVKPRALIFGLDDATAERVGRLFGSWRSIQGFEDVEQREWDVVAAHSVVYAEPHLYVIGMGCATSGRQPLHPTFGSFHSESEPDRAYKGFVMWQGNSKAREFAIPKGLPSSIETLIKTQLVPLTQQEQTHEWLELSVRSAATDQEWASVLQPFLLTRRDQVLAGRFPRPGARSECWCFPDYAISIAPAIVEVALREWRKRDPEVFPTTDWASQSQWRTTSENRLVNELDELEAQRAATLANMRQREAQLESQLAEAKPEAETGERLLLTAQGDELGRIVDECLSSLGFQVTNMDNLDRPGAVRREDLRVTSPDISGWVAVVEVKGYTRGSAKVNDLLKLGRYRTEYLKETGSEPSAVWYVVNQFVGDDPSTRPPMLSSDESTLETFAEDSGLAIDTADLFRLWMAVKIGHLTPEEARSRLVQARGRFVFEDEKDS